MKTIKSITCVLLAVMVMLLTNSCVKEVENTFGSIQGIVTNAATNEPIQGVNVSLSPTGLSTVTGSDGRYEFSNLKEGNYTVQGVKTGFESNTKNITIVSGNVSSGDMVLTPELAEFRLNVEYLDFSTSFTQLYFKIINTSRSVPISWSITESMGWLTATPSSGSLNANEEVVVTVNIDRDQIEQNTTANLTVYAADRTVVLPVNVSVSGSGGPQLQLSETSLDFGTSANTLAFYVMNTGPVGTSLNWNCSNINVDWLMINPMSGNTDGGNSSAVQATIDRNKFNGMVSTSVTISGAGSSATVTISASTEGAGAAILQLNTGSLDFGEDQNILPFTVKNVGSPGTVLDWTISTPSVDWVKFTPMSGSTNAGNENMVSAVIDREKINGAVSTTVTVSSSSNSAVLSISAEEYHPVLEVSTTSIDFGKESYTQTFEIRNTGDEGSSLDWEIEDPTVDWLNVSQQSGTVYSGDDYDIVTLSIDRTKFTGDVTTSIKVTGEGQSKTISIKASTPLPALSVSTTSVDFGKVSSIETFEIRNTGEANSSLNWSISTPSVNWLTVTPMAGSATPNGPSTVTLTVDRNAFVGEQNTTITITGAGSSANITLTVDNRIVVTDGLIAYYTFDDGAITDWGGNYDGLNFDALTSSDTPSGQGLSIQFTGQTDYIYIPHVIMITGVPWSFNVWFKTGQNNCYLFRTNNSNYNISFDGSSRLYVRPGYSWTTSNPFTAYLNNQWHMLTITYNGSSVVAYIDGILFETALNDRFTWDSYYYNTATYFGNSFNGKMDNIRTYSRALTQEEIRALFNAKQ